MTDFETEGLPGDFPVAEKVIRDFAVGNLVAKGEVAMGDLIAEGELENDLTDKDLVTNDLLAGDVLGDLVVGCLPADLNAEDCEDGI